MQQNQTDPTPLERKGAPMLWYIFAAVLVIVTVVALSIFGGTPGSSAH